MTERTQIAMRICSKDSLENLNDHLEGGWKVIHMCGMPSSGSTEGDYPTCLVIIEGEVE